MATIQICLIVILLTFISLKQSESMEIRESDYETHVKNSNGKAFIAYVIEQGDLIVKNKCTCISWNKCNLKNMIKLSKWVGNNRSECVLCWFVWSSHEISNIFICNSNNKSIQFLYSQPLMCLFCVSLFSFDIFAEINVQSVKYVAYVKRKQRQLAFIFRAKSIS